MSVSCNQIFTFYFLYKNKAENPTSTNPLLLFTLLHDLKIGH